MRKIGKTVLSLLLSAALLCSLCLPAGAWHYSERRACEYLITTDGVYWYNTQSMNDWTYAFPENTTVYSADGTVWYTQAGYSNYFQVTVMPGDNMQSLTLTHDFISPDGGMMWVRDPYINNYRFWEDYWQDNYTDGDDMYCRLSSVGYGNKLFTTNPAEPNYYNMMVLPKLPNSMPNYNDCSVTYSMNACTEDKTGILLSTDANQWRTNLDPMLFTDNGTSENVLQSFRSFDPYFDTLTEGYLSPLDNKLHLQNAVPLNLNDPVNSLDPNLHMIYLRSLWDGDIILHLMQNTPEYVYAMLDLRQFPDAYSMPSGPISDWNGGDLQPLFNNRWIFNNYYTDAGSRTYRPIRLMSPEAVIDDPNQDGIINAYDFNLNPDLANSVTLGEYIVPEPSNDTRIVLHVQEGYTYSIPIYIWAEGQSTYAVGNSPVSNANIQLYFSDLYSDSAHMQYPLTYAVKPDNSVVITDFYQSYTNQYTDGIPGDQSGIGCYYDPQTCSLMLPNTIDGKPVTEIYNMAFFDTAVHGTVQEIILPDTIEKIGVNAFDNAIRNVHMPNNVQISDHAFDYCTTATICAQSADGTTAAYASSHNMTFNLCSGHGLTHQHVFGEWVITTAATCTTDGEKTRTCSTCGDTETETIPAPGHDFGEWIVTTEPTYTEEGTKTRTCSRCDATETRPVPIISLNGECGAQGSYVTWSIDYDTGVMTISGTGDMADFTFEPSPWSEHRALIRSVVIETGVTGIGRNAFSSCTNLTDVAFPDNLTSIGVNAFAYCSGLTTLTIPSGVASIGKNAFSYCSSLASLTFDAVNCAPTSQGLSAVFFSCNALTSVTIGEHVRSIPDSLFYGCTYITQLTIPNGVTSIGMYSFNGCQRLTSLTIPDSVTNISSYAFYNCYGLTSVTIPASVTSIGQAPFGYCTGLTGVTVEPGNPAFCNDEYGVLYNKEMTRLIQYPAGNQRTSFTVPDGITSIDNVSFIHSGNLTEVIVPGSVTTIGENTFKFVTAVIYNGSAAGSPWGAKHHYQYTTTSATCTESGSAVYTCTVCGDTYTKTINALGHAYDAVVTEQTCTESGYTTYTCSLCGDTYTADETEPYGHSWGEWTITTPPTTTKEGEQTRTCTRCGTAETEPVPMLPVTAILTVHGSRAKRGDEVDVTVSVENNAGITAAMLYLEYDPQILTLSGIQNGEVFPQSVFQTGGDQTAVPFTVFWADSLAEENNTANGTLVTFTFTVAADAPVGTTTVTVTYDPESTFDKDMQDVAFNVENNGVTVYIPGDADGDGEFDLADVANLSRYLAGGWDVTVDTDTADVNGDGKINLKDVVLMRRALAGWTNVTLV